MKRKTLLTLILAALTTISLRAQDAAAAAPTLADLAQNSNPAVSQTSKSAIASTDTTPGIIEGSVYSKATGRTLQNARIRVKGTIKEIFTDEIGGFRITEVAPGDVELEIYYTGMVALDKTVTLAPGSRAILELELLPYGEKADGETEVVTLEKYSVSVRRETNVGAIATNEQRFSVIPKSVIETDAYGEQTTGNVGDFLKFMPGVAVNYDGADPDSVSVRGFGSAFIAVTSDGAPMANTSGGDDSRAFTFDQIDINNISRIETIKAAIPSIPADTIGGRVNMISNSSFERKTASLKYRVGYTLNSENLEFMRKTPGPLYDYTYKALPGFGMDWTWPITKNFGIVATARIENFTRERHVSQTEWNFLKNPMDRNLQEDPYLQKYTMSTRPSRRENMSGQIRADWRINRNHIFSLTMQVGLTDNISSTRSMTWDINSTDVHSRNQTGIYENREWGYTPEYGYYAESAEAPPGYTGGTISHSVGGNDKKGSFNKAQLKYNYKGNAWNFDADLNASNSKTWTRDGSEGYFSKVKTKIKNTVSRIGIYDIDPNGDNAPSTLKAYAARDADEIAGGLAYGSEIDVFDIQNYTIDTVELSTTDAKEERKNIQVNAQRLLNGLPFQATIQTGAYWSSQKRTNSKGANRMTMLLDVTSDEDSMMAFKEASSYMDYGYSDVSPGWGLPKISWVSPKKLYDTYLLHPEWFSPEKNQARDTARDIYRGDNQIIEYITAFYFQLDARFWENRLSMTTGVRWEMTDDRGYGCLELTEGDSAEDVYQNWVRRGATSHKTYNDLYPSFHLNYDATENFKLRFSYYMAMNRPDFKYILPNLKIKNTDTVYESEIETNNIGLKPYKADNFEVGAEYYFKNGGYVGGSFFYKSIKNFFGSIQTVATLEVLNELGLGTDYLDYIVKTRFNLDTTTTVYGGELSTRMPLGFLGEWGKDFQIEANATELYIDAHPLADLGGFIKQMYNFGIQYRQKKISLGFMANFRGRQKCGAMVGSDYYQREKESTWDNVPFEGFYEYTVPRLTIDVSMEYKFSKRISFYASARDIGNQRSKLERYNTVSGTSAYYSKPWNAERFGASIIMGIKGSF